MNKLTLEQAEDLAAKIRVMLNATGVEPLNTKTIVRQLNIMTMFRPLSESLWGLSLKSPDGRSRFILVNSNSTRGCQHFTIAHELFHLYFDENPEPHFSGSEFYANPSERSANMFASALLMPRAGICSIIPNNELMARNISADTVLRLESLFGVSHTTMVLRLKELNLITSGCAERLSDISITREAALRGYDGRLYQHAHNEGLVIGDFGSMAKMLYDREKISEGHYMELLNMIGYGGEEDSSGC